MSIRIPADNDIADVRIGVNGASEVYLGDVLVWPTTPCGITLSMPLNATPIVDEAKPSKTIVSQTGLVAASVGTPARDCIDFTSGDFLIVTYPYNSNLSTRAFAIESDIFLPSADDVITLFERPPYGGGGSTYSFTVHSKYIFFERFRSSSAEGGPTQDCVKLFFPDELQPNKWYRVIVQREANYRFTVYVKDLDTGVTSTGTTYMPACGGNVETFRDALGEITGQYFSDVSFNASGTTDVKIGGAGYMANYKVTVCQAPYPSIPLIPDPPIDSSYSNVSLLLHFDDLEDQEFIDSGPYNLTATNVGTPQIITVLPVGNTNHVNGMGMTAGLFSGAQLTYPDAPAGLFDLGDGTDFTVEFWAYGFSFGCGGSSPYMLSYMTPVPARYYGGQPAGWSLILSSYCCSQGCSSAYFGFRGSSPTTDTHFFGGTGGEPCVDLVTNPGMLCSNRGLMISVFSGYTGVYSSFDFREYEWNHFAVSRVGGTIRLFFNGILVAYGPAPFNFNAENTLYAAEPDYVPPVFTVSNGSVTLKELRVTKGVGRYTSNFALQSRPWPDGSPEPVIPGPPTFESATLP